MPQIPEENPTPWINEDRPVMPASGRIGKKTPELVDDLIETMSLGGGIASWCREHAINKATVQTWRRRDPEFRERLDQAKVDACMWIEEEIQELVDAPLTDHKDDVAHRKLRAWWREKRLVWNMPQRYGSKVQVGGAHDLPPLTPMTAEEKAAKIAELVELARKRREGEANGTEEDGG